MNEIKLKDLPIFLIASLCLFFPIGFIILLRSNMNAKKKWFSGIAGFLIFCSLLSLAWIRQPRTVYPAQFQLIATRKELSVGQTGGLIISNGEQYYTDYMISASNDVLKTNGSSYTAVKPGKCTITAAFSGEIREIEISVNNERATDQSVLVTTTGERYHLPTAKHAGKNAVEMTEEDALQSGKTPCKNCYK